jgi:transcriptional regulator with XRE-family HTH domain
MIMLQKNLKRIRSEKRISQCELAEKMGVSQSTVGMWECGKNKPKYANLLRIASILEVPISDLLDGIKKDTPDGASENASEKADGASDIASEKAIERTPDTSPERVSATPRKRPSKMVVKPATELTAGNKDVEAAVTIDLEDEEYKVFSSLPPEARKQFLRWCALPPLIRNQSFEYGIYLAAKEAYEKS